MRVKVHAPLPDSAATVDDGSPLTAVQAAQVRAHGRAVTQAMIDRLTEGTELVPGSGSTEEWAGCCAVADALSHGSHYNGVLYATDIVFEPETAVDADTVRTKFAPVEIGWHEDDSCIGSAGIFRVSVETSAAVRIQVSSPCYFIRELDASDGGTLPGEDIIAVTGFLQKAWAH